METRSGSRKPEPEAKVYATESQPGSFLGIIPVLPGCVASGKTRDEAVAKARRGFREYRALLEAHGVAIDHWTNIDPDALPVGELEHEFEHYQHIKEILAATRYSAGGMGATG